MARAQGSKKWLLTLGVTTVLLAAAVTFAQYRKAASREDRLDCVATWLEKARALHGLHIKDPVNIAGDSRRRLMDQIDGAYGCVTKEPSSNTETVSVWHHAGIVSPGQIRHSIRNLAWAGRKKSI